MSGRLAVRAAAILGFLGVMLGAFGAHGLENKLSSVDLEMYRTGVLYHLLHSVALLGSGLIAWFRPESRAIKVANLAFVLGILMFSGSIYLLATDALLGYSARPIVLVTPTGGLAFLIGWGALIGVGLPNPSPTKPEPSHDPES